MSANAEAPGAITLVVPVRNERASIDALVASIEAQTRIPDEVIFVDGASEDGTADRIDELARTSRTTLRCLRLPTASLPGRSRNIGARAASHDWLAFTDAGIEIDATWLDELAKGAREVPGVEVVYGGFRPRVRSRFELLASIAYLSPPVDTPRGPWIERAVFSLLLRRSAFEKTGGFRDDLRSGEDKLFLRALDEAGFPSTQVPEAMITWTLAQDFRELFDKFRLYSCWNLRAGLGNEWHGKLARRYVVSFGAGALAGAFLGPVGSAATSAWAVSTMITLRAGRAVLRHRHAQPASVPEHLARVAGVASILAVIDVATLAGTLDWLREDALALASSPST